jgi:hypothetical protein
VVRDTRVLFLGEMHGTRETPVLAAEYSCWLAAQGKPVTLAIEMPTAEQGALDRYLRSAGTKADRAALVTGSFWHRDSQDGRSSIGTLAMIERIRALKSAGARINLLAIDIWNSPNRDVAMAENIRVELTRDPTRQVVVLIGNVNAIKKRGSMFDANYESTAFHLADVHPVSLNVDFLKGSFWACVDQPMQCKVQLSQEKVGERGRPPGFHMGYSIMPGYDGTLMLPEVTAAEPATLQP